MINMIFLILCIGANILLAHIFKVFDKRGVDNFNAIVINYVVCTLTASAVLGRFAVPLDLVSRPWFGLALSLAFLFITGFNILGLSFQKAGVSLTLLIQKMSLITPVVFAIALYGESLSTLGWVGIACAIGAIVFVNFPAKGEKRISILSPVIMLPIVTFAMSGVIEVLLYYSEASGRVTDDGAEFTASCFFMAGMMGLLYAVYRIFFKDAILGRKELLGGLALGIPNYFSIYLLVFLLGKGWDGAVLFPLNNIGILLAGTALGILAYKESINQNKIIGLILGLLAIVLIGFLG